MEVGSCSQQSQCCVNTRQRAFTSTTWHALLPLQPMPLPSLQVLELLLLDGADVNCCSWYEGLSALHLAAVFGHTDVAHALVEHGACTAVRDGNGRTAAELARVFGQDAFADALVLAASRKSTAAQVGIPSALPHDHVRRNARPTCTIYLVLAP